LPRLAIDMPVAIFILCLLVPGFSFHEAGWKRIGSAIALAWLAGSCVFLLFLGYAAANAAFGLMMSLHVSSVLHLLNRLAPGMGILRRLVLSLAVLFVVGQLIYAAGLHWFENHLFMPLQTGGKVYVVNRLRSVETLRAGDLVAFYAERTTLDRVYIREGYVLDRILAGPRDEVQFGSGQFRVNGVAATSKEMMPHSHSLIIPEKTWLIWPSLTTITRNNVGEDAMARSVLRMALVSREQIIGKPFHHWFWRDQTR
jgi:hypothetical protein